MAQARRSVTMPLRELRDVIVVRHASHVSNSSSVSPVQGFGDGSVVSRLLEPRRSSQEMSCESRGATERLEMRLREVLAGALSGASVARLDRICRGCR